MVNVKIPTQKEKIEMYENFLHKLNSCMISCNQRGIEKLLQNADLWSYSHRLNGKELNKKEQQKLIYGRFWNLCNID